MDKRAKRVNLLLYVVLTVMALLFLAPVFVVLMNSFKGQFLSKFSNSAVYNLLYFFINMFLSNEE